MWKRREVAEGMHGFGNEKGDNALYNQDQHPNQPSRRRVDLTLRERWKILPWM